jgi:hypothetical protein
VDWEPDGTIASVLAPRPAVAHRHRRAVTRVTGGGPVEYGEAVQFEF